MKNEQTEDKSSETPRALALAWYSAAEWKQFKETSMDRDGFHDRYGQWLQNAERKYILLRRQGHEVTKIQMRMTEFLDWCQGNGRKNDGLSRATYVNELHMAMKGQAE